MEHATGQSEATSPSLTDWYRYVDRLSRPASRNEEEGEPVEWRPWLEIPDPEPLPAPPLENVPDLGDLLGKSALIPHAAAPAREEFEDLTVHDRLPEIPVFSVPALRPPTFELDAPRWGETAQAAVEEGSAAEEDMGVKGGAATSVNSAVARIKDSPNWELLNRARGEDPESVRGRTGESRRELIERLVDPTLSLEQAATILGVCPTTVRRYTNKGQLRHFRTKGNQRRFRLSDVVEFMESRAAEIEADSRADQAADLEGSTDE